MKCNYGKHKKRSNGPSKSAEVTPITPELLRDMKKELGLSDEETQTALAVLTENGLLKRDERGNLTYEG